MMLFNAGYLALLALSVVPDAFAQQQPLLINTIKATQKVALTPEIRQFVRNLLENWNIPGLSLGVVHSGGTVEVASFGNRTEDGAETTPETLFNLASCSKAFTASALGILMDDYAHGRNVTPLPKDVHTFDWQTKVQDMLPDDWRLMDEWASRKATFRDIMSHQSGLPSHSDFSSSETDTVLDVVRRMRHLRPAYELRQQFEYNNLMYMVAAYVVSVYSEMPLSDFVRRRIWTPLGMSTSTYNVTEASNSNLLTQSWTAEGRRLPNLLENPAAAAVAAGPGGIMSSVIDLAKWLNMLLNSGVDPRTNVTILPSSVFQAITSGHVIVEGKPADGPFFSISAYGMGWNRQSYQGHEFLVHGGGVPGFSSYLTFYPSANIGIVILSNGDAKHVQQLAIIYRIVEDFLSLPRLASTRYASMGKLPDFAPEQSMRFEPEYSMGMSRLPVEEIAGTYVNSGYQNITLCAPKFSNSSACQDVLDAFKHFDDPALIYQGTLYAAFNSVFVSHLRVRRLYNATFEAEFTTLYPEGYGRDKSPFKVTMGSGICEFVIEEGKVAGFGLDFFKAPQSGRTGTSIKDTADVWYERV